MESEEAVKLRAASTAIEGKLEDARNKMRLGATIGGDFVELSSVGLRSKMRVDPKEEVRRACWDGLRTIGDFVVANGFVELVASRNQMAKALGYVDYYDYKVTQAEGFGKAELFKILDTLEAGTRPLMKEARARLEADKGASALQPWNSAFAMAGDVTKKLDPFFPFGRARVPGSRAGLACATGGVALGAAHLASLLPRVPAPRVPARLTSCAAPRRREVGRAVGALVLGARHLLRGVRHAYVHVHVCAYAVHGDAYGAARMAQRARARAPPARSGPCVARVARGCSLGDAVRHDRQVACVLVATIPPRPPSLRGSDAHACPLLPQRVDEPRPARP